MSVRATERLIGDVVMVSKIPNSAKMVVQSVDEEAKKATTIWFSDDRKAQTGVFPVNALDRVIEQKPAASTKKTSTAKGKPAGKKK